MKCDCGAAAKNSIRVKTAPGQWQYLGHVCGADVCTKKVVDEATTTEGPPAGLQIIPFDARAARAAAEGAAQ